MRFFSTSRFFWICTSRLFLTIVSVAALLLCPHSKVEESFNLQATHDLYYHGVIPAVKAAFQEKHVEGLPYDHIQYPGVVPRTFTGPLLLASVCRFLGILLSPIMRLSDYPMLLQFLVRLLLLATHWHAWFRLARAAGFRFGGCVEVYFVLVTACQFHLPFYGSRMLPNVFALLLVTHAYADVLRGKAQRTAALLVTATVVFRCDVLLLLTTVGLYLLLSKQLYLIQAIRVGLTSTFVSLMMTVPTDSLLWQRLVWPEGEVFYFNTVMGKSREWGTSPWHWYVTNALPKSMLATLFLVPLSFLRIPEYLASRWAGPSQTRPPLLDLPVLEYLLPVVGFIGLYSFLGHKEMRFIFPALPMLNVAAAVGLNRLHRLAWAGKAKTTKDDGNVTRASQSSNTLAWVLYVGGVLALIMTSMASLLFLAVSRHNYPGGQALSLLTRHVVNAVSDTNGVTSVRVHIDVASAMTGVSLFGQSAATGSSFNIEWTFEKAGYEEAHAQVGDYSTFTHILSEGKDIRDFHVVDIAQGYPKFDFRQATIVTEDAVYALERNGWNA